VNVPNHESAGSDATARDLKNQEGIGFDAMCNDTALPDYSKKLLGCDMPLRVGLLLDGTCREGTEFSEDGQWCIPIDYGLPTGPIRTGEAGPMYNLSQYKIDDGVEQEKKIKRDKLEEFQETQN